MSDLPTGWQETTIGEIAQIETGSTPSKSNSRYYEREVCFYKPGDLDAGGLVSRSEDMVSTAGAAAGRLLPSHTLLVTCIGNLGKSALTSSPSICNQQINAVLPTPAAEPKYLYYWSRTIRPWLEENSSATTVSIINKGRFSQAPITLAPLNEQHRIVAKIDSLSAKSKRARDQLDHIPRLVEKYKQAILAAAFRGELTHTWREGSEQSAAQTLSKVRSERKSAELSSRRRAALSNSPRRPPQLPGLPTTWVWACIEELAADDNRAIQSGPFGSSLLHSEFQETGYLVIGIDNVQDGIFSLGSQNRIGETKFFELERFRARPHDVLVTVMATVGRTCVLPGHVEPAIITKHVYRVTVDKRLVLPHYLMNALRGSEVVLEQMGANVRGQTRPGLNGTIIKSIHIPLAPLDEQVEILRVIGSAIAWINRLAPETTSARKLIDHLDQAVLAKAFRGELVPQDPNDEPASALLERIRADRQGVSTPSHPKEQQKKHRRVGAGIKLN